jgi:hypothetical protein
MPGRGGIELYEAVRARFPERVVRIGFQSGAFDKDDLAYRGRPWVREPTGAQRLRDLVRDLTA